MTTDTELKSLIAKAESCGAVVHFELDVEAQIDEGRDVIRAVRIERLHGVGPCWMSALSAAERLRAVL